MAAEPAGIGRLPALGSVHGFSVRSASRFLYLRHGGGDPLTVLEDGSEPDRPGDPLAELTSRKGVRTRVYGGNGAYSVHIENLGWFAIDSGASTIAVPPAEHAAWMEPTVWGLPAALLALARGGRFLHAAAVEIDGRAVILTGPSQHGKTTLAAALAAAGHRVLSEDLLRCDIGPASGAESMAYPGPAVLRLRRDVAEWLAVPGAEPVVRDAEKVHLSIDPERRGTGDPLAIGAIVLLYPGEEPSLERVDPQAAVRDLWVVSLNIPTPDGRAACFRDIVQLARTVPIWRLERPLTRPALEPAAESVLRAARAL